MDMLIRKEFRFEAAHRLPNHRGKCASPHGHSYKLEVAVTGPVNGIVGASDEGMVMDFSDLSATVDLLIVNRLDHQDLNEVLAGKVRVTTAECIAAWIWNELEGALHGRTLAGIRLWETAKCYAQVGSW